MAGQGSDGCTGQERCAFGNCLFRKTALEFSQNIGDGGCNSPVAEFLASLEEYSTTSEETKEAIELVRNTCGGEKRRAAQCEVTRVATAEDLFLHVIATFACVVRGHYLRGKYRRDGARNDGRASV